MSRLALLALAFASPVLADEVNIYSHRQPELIQPLMDAFTAETGITVNIAFVDKGMAERLKAEGIVFIGPTPENIAAFGLKHTARDLAQQRGVPLLPGSGLLGDLAQAQALYLPARAAYQRLAPAAQRLAELDNQINARADYFEQREQDPQFVGFHRIEYGLFQQRSTAGLSSITARLLADVSQLKQQLLAQSLPPEQLVSSVVRNLRSLADVRATSGEEERYSHLDLNGFAANLEAARKVFELLRPLLSKGNGPLLEQIDRSATALDAELDSLRLKDGYRHYDSVAPDTRKRIADQRTIARLKDMQWQLHTGQQDCTRQREDRDALDRHQPCGEI